MKIVSTIEDIRREVAGARLQGKSIGFVPTMGYLHEGHLSLILKSKSDNSYVVVSIFVNPTQFGVGEDYETYPRNMDHDAKLCEAAGADIIFHPTVEEMYPYNFKTSVEVTGLTEGLCGASRPSHFKGVTTVVAKLFNIVKPDKAYFGQKDAQQVAVIQQMSRDLNMEVQVIPCAIVRESDGLAMSSRNIHLNHEERNAALILYRSLLRAKELLAEGMTCPSKLRQSIVGFIEDEPLASIDYVEIVNAASFEPVSLLKGDILVALAVRIGKTRLIDNIRLEV
ncbi:MAG: pantoate--beta-alanine ligase [Clostridia bacterium]